MLDEQFMPDTISLEEYDGCIFGRIFFGESDHRLFMGLPTKTQLSLPLPLLLCYFPFPGIIRFDTFCLSLVERSTSTVAFHLRVNNNVGFAGSAARARARWLF